MTLPIAIVYHSAYGHTAKVAQAVAEGARAGAHVDVMDVAAMTEADWQTLDRARAIIFGSPTYMGGVSAPFKAFMDATSKRWFAQEWKDKIAAGFTNAGTMGGDNLNALYQMAMFAMQHSMLWVGTGIMPARTEGGLHINRTGAFAGLMTQAGNESPDITPPADDIETARLFGARVAEIAVRFIY